MTPQENADELIERFSHPNIYGVGTYNGTISAIEHCKGVIDVLKQFSKYTLKEKEQTDPMWYWQQTLEILKQKL